MIPHHFFYLIVVLGLLWIFFMLPAAWPRQGGVTPQRSGEPESIKPRRTRSQEPPPFAGLTQKPPCVLCEYEAFHPTPPLPLLRCPRLTGGHVRSIPPGISAPMSTATIAAG